METLAQEGLELSPVQDAQLRRAEEEIIQKEILPVLSERIEPVLGQIERKLVLVVDYIPGEPLKVSLSRRRNLSEVLGDVVEIKPDSIVEHRVIGPQMNPTIKKAPQSKLRVTMPMPDGRVLAYARAKDTFIEVIKRIGVEKIRPLGITVCNVPLVSNTIDSKYKSSQHSIGNGWYVITHSSTADKKQKLEQISSMLHLDLKVEVI